VNTGCNKPLLQNLYSITGDYAMNDMAKAQDARMKIEASWNTETKTTEIIVNIPGQKEMKIPFTFLFQHIKENSSEWKNLADEEKVKLEQWAEKQNSQPKEKKIIEASEITKDTPLEQVPENIRDWQRNVGDKDFVDLAKSYNPDFLDMIADTGYSVVFDWLQENNVPENIISLLEHTQAIKGYIKYIQAGTDNIFIRDVPYEIVDTTRLIYEINSHKFNRAWE
jgi:hypothetical protein